MENVTGRINNLESELQEFKVRQKNSKSEMVEVDYSKLELRVMNYYLGDMEQTISELNKEICNLKNELLAKTRDIEVLTGTVEALKFEKGYILNRTNKVDRELDNLKYQYGTQIPMDYEDRDILVLKIFELIDKRVIELGILLEQDALWSDELLYAIDDLIEPYTTGTWRNYN